MKDRFERVIDAIAADVQVIVQTLMDKEASGGRCSSIKELKDLYSKEDIVVEVSSSGGSNKAFIEVLYDSLLEWDRAPRTGKWPSVDDIREWALSKNLPADNRTLNLIRRSIWWNGHAGQSIEQAVEHEIEKQMEGRWADMLHDIVVEELEKVFG